MRPKFYWFDPAVARFAAGLGHEPIDRAWKSFALETLIFHELRVFNEVSGNHRPVCYYHTAAGVEIDFIIETRKRREGSKPTVVCIEVKSAERWDGTWNRALRDLDSSGNVNVDGLYGVYRGNRRLSMDGVQVLPVAEFLSALHAWELF